MSPVRAAALLTALAAAAPTGAAEVIGPLPEGNAEALRIIAASAATCAEDEAGALRIEDGAYVVQDLDGDGDGDLVLNFDHIQCQYNLARWAGTGGTPKWFILDGSGSIEIWGGAWSIVDLSPFPDDPADIRRLILIPVHGTYCDGFGAQPCWRVLTAFEGGFSTLPEPAE